LDVSTQQRAVDMVLSLIDVNRRGIGTLLAG